MTATATEVTGTLQERAKEAVAKKAKHDREYRQEQHARRQQDNCDALVREMKSFGIEITGRDISLDDEDPYVAVDGLVFRYQSDRHRLVLVRPCKKREDCQGFVYDVLGIGSGPYALEYLGRLLEQPAEHTECQVEYEERERKLEARRAEKTPSPTVEDRFISALRELIHESSPEF